MVKSWDPNLSSKVRDPDVGRGKVQSRREQAGAIAPMIRILLRNGRGDTKVKSKNDSSKAPNRDAV